MSTTIHIIANAHIDPVWLWPWQDGLDEALATCRSACDRLDAHPDLCFTQGEAWIFQQIERCDPELFDRIGSFITAGRWEPLSPWWTQPDCNLPSGFALRQQMELGLDYFTDRFGLRPRCGYNIDSFGHAASLPSLLHATGQDRYVFMRPQEHELDLPARLFRWRGFADEDPVTCFRVAGSYNGKIPDRAHLERAVQDLPAGCDHSMCFVGVGDHGGGPTERMIAWIKEHRDAVPGARLEFSTVSRFFDAVADLKETLPIHTGELQHHAIGCYSVHRGVKTALRRAEHRLHQAEIVLAQDGSDPDGRSAEHLQRSWQQTCFHQFHDTLGGTCLPSAYGSVLDQLGGAAGVGDELAQQGLRRMMRQLPADERQRVILFNASDRVFDDWIAIEPYLDHHWEPHWRLVDGNGDAVPVQHLHAEASTWMGTSRMLLRRRISAGAMDVLAIARDGAPPALDTQVQHGVDHLANNLRVAVHLGSDGRLRRGDLHLPLPRLDLIDDVSDTWSHGIDRYPDGPVQSAQWHQAAVLETGPLMGALVQEGRIGDSTLRAEWRLYAGGDAIDLRLIVHWRERQKILKLTQALNGAPGERDDGIPGRVLQRHNDGIERPLRDFTTTAIEGGAFGIVCPDVFAVDATPARLRCTLLRAPYLAHHAPHGGPSPRASLADQGVHEFRFRFVLAEHVDMERLDDLAHGLQRPPLHASSTKGMSTRYPWYEEAG